MLNKRYITLPAVYCRPFASEEQETANLKSFQIARNNFFEWKVRQYTEGKAMQHLFNIDRYTCLARYRNRGSKR